MFYISELLQSLSPWRVNSYLKYFFVSHQVHIACDGRNGGVKHQVYPRSAEKHFLNVTYGELSAIVAVIYASTDCLTAIILDYLFSCSFTPSVFSLLQQNQLRQRFDIMEDNDRQQAPPLPTRTNFERTITVVRGNRSLGMFPVFLVVMVSWCVYIAGMTIMAIIGGGDDDCSEEEWWSD